MAEDQRYEQALTHAVDQLFAMDPTNVRPKTVRAIAEQELDLEEDFFIQDKAWKARSKEILQVHFEKLLEETEPSTAKKPKKPKKRKSPDAEADAPPKKAKRSGHELLDESRDAIRNGRNKKGKSASEIVADGGVLDGHELNAKLGKGMPKNMIVKKPESSSESEAEGSPVASKTKAKKKATKAPTPMSVDSDEDAPTAPSKPKGKGRPSKPSAPVENDKRGEHGPKSKQKVNKKTPKAPTSMSIDDDSPSQPPTRDLTPTTNPQSPSKPDDEGLNDSDLSSLIDEPPKRQRKKKEPSKPTDPSSKPGKPPKTPTTSTPYPQDTQLKTHQTHLLECGVRKIWGMHLKKFGTHKEKVSELKRMLREVGIEGRFSREKARQIKEERELKADLEAVKEGEAKWGKGEEDGERKRRVNARRVAEFDDEESD